jgi:hypothetical protein
MGVVEGGGGAGFAKKPLLGLGMEAELGREELQGDGAAELRVFRLEDNPHPAPAQLSIDPVPGGEETAFG